ncbi:MAG: hypothetical protein AAF065_10155 [Verrucomicrobiota bacterium]
MVKVLQLIVLIVVFVLGYSFGSFTSEEKSESPEKDRSPQGQVEFQGTAAERGLLITAPVTAQTLEVIEQPNSGALQEARPTVTAPFDGRITLTNLEGAKLDVTLVDADENTVKIRRGSDLREFTIKLDTLQPADRQAIENWRSAREPASKEPDEVDLDAIFSIFK